MDLNDPAIAEAVSGLCFPQPRASYLTPFIFVNEQANGIDWTTIYRVCGEIAVSRSIGESDDRGVFGWLEDCCICASTKRATSLTIVNRRHAIQRIHSRRVGVGLFCLA
jgi:hypothetical protein